MKYKVRKGPEYSPSSQTFSLEEIEQRLRGGEIDSTYQVRADGQTIWQSVADISSVTIAPALIRSKPPSQASAPGERFVTRYRDAYLVATAAIAFATIIKFLGWLLAILTWVGGFILASQQHGSGQGMSIVAALISGVLQLIVLHFFGVLVAAAGQILRASLDTAVHSSPFLDDQQKTAAMGI